VNTSALKPKFQVQVILANDSFSRYNVDTVIAGGLPGWHRFEASMPLTTSDNAMFIAFTVKETKGVGAPGSQEVSIITITAPLRIHQFPATSTATRRSDGRLTGTSGCEWPGNADGHVFRLTLTDASSIGLS
jgi:hypothetical protein